MYIYFVILEKTVQLGIPVCLVKHNHWIKQKYSTKQKHNVFIIEFYWSVKGIPLKCH